MTEPVKPFFSLMTEVRAKTPEDLKSDLDMHFGLSGSLACPVPGCSCLSSFTRWGEMFDHFVNNGHHREYFNAYQKKYHRAFSSWSGPNFKYGVQALILALLLQPTTLEQAMASSSTRKAKTASTKVAVPTSVVKVGEVGVVLRPKKIKKAEGDLFGSKPTESTVEEPEVFIPAEPPRTVRKSAFSQLSELIRNSKEISIVWRGSVMDKFIDIFHGIPPCLHCRAEEGKQIQHQDPLFHEIVLLALNKHATLADVVMEKKTQGDETPFQTILKEVFDYHMKEGRVLAVPYCQGCNMDAEAKRRKTPKIRIAEQRCRNEVSE